MGTDLTIAPRAGSSVADAPFVDTGPTEGPPDALVLDIGGDIGALILYADRSCLGREIDITPAGLARSHHTHNRIRRRRSVGRELIAGVYPELHAGVYTVWGIDDEPLCEVTILGGHVTEVQVGDCRSH